MSPTALAILAAWIPAAMALFRAIGPRRAAPIVLLAGFLLLPRESGPMPHLGLLGINKRVVTGLALLAGVLVSDPRTLLRARARPLDLPMVAFVLLPLASLAANRFADWAVVVDLTLRNLAEWGLPYFVGRLYFGDREGPRRLAVGIVVAGLLSIPLFVFEMAAGPRRYLAGLAYGIGHHENMVDRMGGWRPEGFLTNGIEVATWLALAATLAAWLALRRAWSPPGLPAWTPAMALSVVTVACRGVYGDANLAIGMVAAFGSHFLRTRAFLILLAVVPPAYLGARIAGAWDGQDLVRLAAKAGRPDTVAYRLAAEGRYLAKVVEHGSALGFGGSDSAIFDFGSQRHLWPDGWWVHQLRVGGVVGLAAFFLALFLIPAGLGLALPAGRAGGPSPGAMARGLSLFLLLHAADSLHNMALLMPTPLIGGSLVGVFLARKSARVDVDEPLRTGSGTKVPSRRPVPLLATIMVLILLEILGRRTRPSVPTATRPTGGIEGSEPADSTRKVPLPPR